MSAEPEPQSESIDPRGHIVRTPGVVGGRPRIAGTRVRVVDVVDWHQGGRLSVEEIVANFPLSLADVYASLAYYHDHRDEIEEERREDEQYVERLLEQHPDRVHVFEE